MFEVNTEDLEKCLIEDLKAGLVPMVASSPGMGKSSIIKNIAKKFNLKLIDMRISQHEPVDINGYPSVVDGRMVFHTPEYFPLEDLDEVPEGYDGWLLFLDEFNSGHKQTEAAAYKLILDREVYKYKLHPRVTIAAAGNLATDKAIVNTQSTATTSRLIHYRLSTDHDAWVRWANANDIDHRIISYIKFKPEALHRFNPNTDEMTFPCPRTWEFASKVIKNVNQITGLTITRLAGTLGEGTAVEFSTFTKIYQNLPTIEQILENPVNGWRVPSESSEKYAITTLISHNMKESTIEPLMKAVARLPLEFQSVTIKDVYRKSPELKRHPLIKEWVATNAADMFG